MSYKNIIEETEGGLTRVTINRPNALNALNNETIDELITLFQGIKEDDTTQAVIITGAGEKAFVAGADIKELATLTPPEAKYTAEKGQFLFRTIQELGKPVLAAINGFALGGGLELAMSCSFRYASENAKMGQPEINLGLIPGYGGTQRLPRQIGKGRAMELLLTGNMFDAQEAYRVGLVNRVLPQEELLPAAEKTMRIVLQKSSLIIRYILQSVNNGLNMHEVDGMALEANLFSMCAASEDMREGTDAFINKRKPDFKGK